MLNLPGDHRARDGNVLLTQAQETTARNYESARKEAEVILREAEMKAAKLVEQANTDLQRTNAELIQLGARKDSILGRLRVLLSSELDLIRAMDRTVTIDFMAVSSYAKGTTSSGEVRLIKPDKDIFERRLALA